MNPTVSTGIMFENAVNAQHQLNLAGQAATVTGVSELFTLDPAEQAVAASKINMSDLAAYLGSLIVALNAAERIPIPVPRDETLAIEIAEEDT